MDRQMEFILQGGQFKKLLDEQSAELRQKYNMKKAELEVLYFLSRSGGQDTSSDIHAQLLMNRGHISQAVDSLCKRRYIIAIPDQNDRRYIHYKVLDSAQEIVAEMSKRREEMNRQILKGISEEELKIFRDVLLKIKRNIESII